MSAEADRVRAALVERLLEHDKHGAVAVALTAVTSGRVTIEELYREVLGPAAVEIGGGWQRGAVAVWEEHLATAAVRTIVEALYPEVERLRAERPAAGYSALMACPPEEAHDLGLRMLADRLALDGWAVFYLGPDTPFEEVVAAARELGVDAVVLSSSTHYHRLRVRDFVERLAEALPGVGVWVGGPGFVGATHDWPSEFLFDEAAVFAGRPPLPPSRPAAPVGHQVSDPGGGGGRRVPTAERDEGGQGESLESEGVADSAPGAPDVAWGAARPVSSGEVAERASAGEGTGAATESGSEVAGEAEQSSDETPGVSRAAPGDTSDMWTWEEGASSEKGGGREPGRRAETSQEADGDAPQSEGDDAPAGDGAEQA